MQIHFVKPVWNVKRYRLLIWQSSTSDFGCVLLLVLANFLFSFRFENTWEYHVRPDYQCAMALIKGEEYSFL